MPLMTTHSSKMPNTRSTIVYAIMMAIFLVGCQSEKEELPLFELVNAETTGVNFINDLRESASQNVLTYEYYYNGAGIAAADFNNDGLTDLFFVSNIGQSELYLNKGEFQLEPVTEAAGIKLPRGFSTGVTTVDINNDGLTDIYLCRSGRYTNEKRRENLLYVNQGINDQGVPQFKELGAEYSLNISGYSTQAAFFDYDRDGDLDMFLINHGIDTYADEEIEALRNTNNPNIGEQLFQNQNGVFVEVTKDAGIIQNSLGFGLGVGVGDFNNNGFPDIYVSNDYSGKDNLYINQGDGSFKEGLNEMVGHTSFYSMGNDVADINNDGLLDIMVLDMAGDNNYDIKTSMSAMNPQQFENLKNLGQHRQYMYNSLLINRGTSDHGVTHFSDVAHFTGMASTDWSWGPLLFDFDNDGWKDAFITNGIKRNIRNNDAMKRVSKLNQALSTARNKNEVAALFKDALDQFPSHAKANYFYKNNGQLDFSDISGIVGADSILTTSNGAVYADLDNDGDLDLIINNANQKAMIYRNNSSQSSNFLQIIAKGSETNPSGIGLKAKIKIGQASQVAELYTTRGYLSSVEPMIHFGIDSALVIDNLELTWPDGKVEVMKNMPVNQRLVVDYKNAVLAPSETLRSEKIFQDKSDMLSAIPPHVENEFDDYRRESLLPHKMSQMGPAITVGDVDNDGLDDVFIGGAMGISAKIYKQNVQGEFISLGSRNFNGDKDFEDVVAVFSDLENDGDLDLIVGTGGNELPDDSTNYPLRFYLNNGKGEFTRSNVMDVFCSVSVISLGDFDQDGDDDLFIGGRQVPGYYGRPANSFILRNESSLGQVKFTDVTTDVAPFLKNYGMVTDAKWSDFNGDGTLDLATCGEWMHPSVHLNDSGILIDNDGSNGLEAHKGWWFSIEIADIDNDGDQDLVAGNLGLNYKYKASMDEPFVLYTNDFDQNGTEDIVLTYPEKGDFVPVRGRECSSSQMPFIKEKFPTYDAFGKAGINDIFNESDLAAALRNEVTDFSHSIFINDGKGQFYSVPLPSLSQISSVNDIIIEDFNNDDKTDILLVGNLLQSEVETPVSDAGYGLFLEGDGKGTFRPVANQTSGLYITGESKVIKKIKLSGSSKKHLLIGRNADSLKLISY